MFSQLHISFHNVTYSKEGRPIQLDIHKQWAAMHFGVWEQFADQASTIMLQKQFELVSDVQTLAGLALQNPIGSAWSPQPPWLISFRSLPLTHFFAIPPCIPPSPGLIYIHIINMFVYVHYQDALFALLLIIMS